MPAAKKKVDEAKKPPEPVKGAAKKSVVVAPPPPLAKKEIAKGSKAIKKTESNSKPGKSEPAVPAGKGSKAKTVP